MSEVSLSFDFIDEYVRFTNPEYLQVYIYERYLEEKNGEIPTPEEVAEILDMKLSRVKFIFEYWKSRNEFSDSKKGSRAKKTGKSESFIKRAISTKPSYSQVEIDAVAADNKQISTLFYQAEKILKKVLSPSDMELLFSFNDWLGLPVEVILMLLVYADKKGKATKRYLETVAIDWSEKGIDSFEAAEEYVSYLEKTDSAENMIKSVLGINNRGLTVTEKKYIKLWSEDRGLTEELIVYAYDKTVEYTGKLSYAYMDKMLKDWSEKGYHTLDEVKAADDEFYKTKDNDEKNTKSKPSRFNNYEDGNKNDYAELEEQILDMMLDDDYK